MGKLTDKVAKGVFWVLMEKSGIQLVHFAVTLVLARLLTPDDYGTVALLSIFISLSNVFVDCGFGKALVQKKNATQTDMNSVFYLSVAVAAILYTALFFGAPLVARFYGIPELKTMLRILALSLIFHSINGVQNVELNRKMLFKLSFRISWVRAIVSAVTGIALALAGWGPWALVYSSLAGGITGVVARQLVIRWRPTLTFSWTSVRELFRFGWKMTVTNLFTHCYNEIYGLLIGKFYARADLAFVKKGGHVPRMARGLAEGALSRVAFSALAKLQDNPKRLCRAMRKMIRCATFVVMPIMVILAVVAEPLVCLLFGERWLPAVPYLRVACIGGLTAPFITINTQALMARGRSDIVMKIMFVYRILGFCVMAVTIPIGVMAFYLANVLFSAVFGVIVWTAPNRRQLGYKVKDQIADTFPTIVAVMLAGTASAAVIAMPCPSIWLLVPGVAVGCMVFAGASILLRNRAMRDVLLALAPVLVKKFPSSRKLIMKVVSGIVFEERKCDNG